MPNKRGIKRGNTMEQNTFDSKGHLTLKRQVLWLELVEGYKQTGNCHYLHRMRALINKIDKKEESCYEGNI